MRAQPSLAGFETIGVLVITTEAARNRNNKIAIVLSELEGEPFIGFAEETFPRRNHASPLALELLDCGRNRAVPKQPRRQVNKRRG